MYHFSSFCIFRFLESNFSVPVGPDKVMVRRAKGESQNGVGREQVLYNI